MRKRKKQPTKTYTQTSRASIWLCFGACAAEGFHKPLRVRLQPPDCLSVMCASCTSLSKFALPGSMMIEQLGYGFSGIMMQPAQELARRFGFCLRHLGPFPENYLKEAEAATAQIRVAAALAPPLGQNAHRSCRSPSLCAVPFVPRPARHQSPSRWSRINPTPGQKPNGSEVSGP